MTGIEAKYLAKLVLCPKDQRGTGTTLSGGLNLAASAGLTTTSRRAVTYSTAYGYETRTSGASFVLAAS